MTETPNPELREHVTNVGFSLTLSKTMIDHLVLVHHFKGKGEILHRLRLKSWVVTMRCLRDRGLINWANPIYKKDSNPPTIESWTPYGLTKAGKLVIELLKEAGIYQDRIKELTSEKAA